MYMCTAQNTDIQRKESGSALVVTMIVLAILTVLGLAALDVADVNILISANDRDSKNSFFMPTLARMLGMNSWKQPSMR